MQIHELTQRPKKINEDLKSFLGLNNATVAQAWDEIGGELMQDLAARYTKDPKYANMPLAQRKKAMAADSNTQQIGTKKYGEWNQYIAGVQAKSPIPLTDDQYKAAFLNWMNQSLFNNKFSSLDAAAKQNANMYINGFLRYRNTPEPKKTEMQVDHLKLLIADETARMVQAATDLQQAQAGIGQPQQPQQTTATATAPTPAGYSGATYNVPTAGAPRVSATQSSGTQQKQPTANKVVPLKPQDVEKIAANVSKAPA